MRNSSIGLIPESPGMFYLVSNRSGTGKTIVHRPRPPSQSSPQEGNFDALPGDASTSNDLGRRISRPRKRPVLAIRTSPPPIERKLDSPSLESKYLWLDPVRATWNSLRRKNRNPEQVNGHAVHSKGKQRADVLTEEDERQHDNSKSQDIRAWVMMGKPSADVQRSATYPHRQSEARRSPTRNHKKARHATEGTDMFRSRTGTSSMGKYGRGPPPGQTYDIVNRQIIENNPDKTVELSTWKEHSEKAISPGDAERISVYYVTAGELELGEEDKENIQVEWRYDGRNATDTPQRVPSSVTASKVSWHLPCESTETYLFIRGLQRMKYLVPEEGNLMWMSTRLSEDTAPFLPVQAKRTNPQEQTTKRPLRKPRAPLFLHLHLHPATKVNTHSPLQSRKIYLRFHSMPHDQVRPSAA